MSMDIGTGEIGVHFGGRPDRRGNSRFPVREEVKYKVLQSPKATPIVGTGETLNIGSGGILFTTPEKLTVGQTVEMAVNWPARIGGTCPLKFVAIGRVVRADASKAAVRIEKYEFKTRSAAGLNLGSIA